MGLRALLNEVGRRLPFQCVRKLDTSVRRLEHLARAREEIYDNHGRHLNWPQVCCKKSIRLPRCSYNRNALAGKTDSHG